MDSPMHEPEDRSLKSMLPSDIFSHCAERMIRYLDLLAKRGLVKEPKRGWQIGPNLEPLYDGMPDLDQYMEMTEHGCARFMAILGHPNCLVGEPSFIPDQYLTKDQLQGLLKFIPDDPREASHKFRYLGTFLSKEFERYCFPGPTVKEVYDLFTLAEKELSKFELQLIHLVCSLGTPEMTQVLTHAADLIPEEIAKILDIEITEQDEKEKRQKISRLRYATIEAIFTINEWRLAIVEDPEESRAYCRSLKLDLYNYLTQMVGGVKDLQPSWEFRNGIQQLYEQARCSPQSLDR